MADLSFRVEPLSAAHERRTFASGVEALDRYLHEQAGQDQRRRVVAVYVLCSETVTEQRTEKQPVAGFYTLSSCSIEPYELAPEVTQRMPRYPVLPGILIGRLALDQRYQGQGLGMRLLGDALRRSATLSSQLGSVAVVVDAKDDNAAAFYQHFGFRPFSGQPSRLYLPVQTIIKELGHLG